MVKVDIYQIVKGSFQNNKAKHCLSCLWGFLITSAYRNVKMCLQLIFFLLCTGFSWYRSTETCNTPTQTVNICSMCVFMDAYILKKMTAHYTFAGFLPEWRKLPSGFYPSGHCWAALGTGDNSDKDFQCDTQSPLWSKLSVRNIKY